MGTALDRRGLDLDRLIDTFFGIDTELLHQADQVLARQGISLRDAVIGYLEHIVEAGRAPELPEADTAPVSAGEMETEAFEDAVADVAKGSVYTSAEIKAYLRQMEGRL